MVGGLGKACEPISLEGSIDERKDDDMLCMAVVFYCKALPPNFRPASKILWLSSTEIGLPWLVTTWLLFTGYASFRELVDISLEYLLLLD